MIGSSEYPTGAQYDSNAPYNETDNSEEIPVKADVIITLSSTIHSTAIATFEDDVDEEGYHTRAVDEVLTSDNEIYHEATDSFSNSIERAREAFNLIKDCYSEDRKPEQRYLDYLENALNDLLGWKLEDMYIESVEENED